MSRQRRLTLWISNPVILMRPAGAASAGRLAKPPARPDNNVRRVNRLVLLVRFIGLIFGTPLLSAFRQYLLFVRPDFVDPGPAHGHALLRAVVIPDGRPRQALLPLQHGQSSRVVH